LRRVGRARFRSLIAPSCQRGPRMPIISRTRWRSMDTVGTLFVGGLIMAVDPVAVERVYSVRFEAPPRAVLYFDARPVPPNHTSIEVTEGSHRLGLGRKVVWKFALPPPDSQSCARAPGRRRSGSSAFRTSGRSSTPHLRRARRLAPNVAGGVGAPQEAAVAQHVISLLTYSLALYIR